MQLPNGSICSEAGSGGDKERDCGEGVKPSSALKWTANGGQLETVASAPKNPVNPHEW